MCLRATVVALPSKTVLPPSTNPNSQTGAATAPNVGPTIIIRERGLDLEKSAVINTSAFTDSYL